MSDKIFCFFFSFFTGEFMQKILALILAGGRVDDLKTLTKYRPKSAVPFGGKYRIIDFPLSNLMHSQIGTVGLLSEYWSSPLIVHMLDGRSLDLWGLNRSLTLLPPFKGEKDSDWYKGTIDAVYQNIDFIRIADPELVLIVSGDHIYKMDYREIIKYHLSKKADLTIGFTRIEPSQSGRFGVAELDEEDGNFGGRIFGYYEKPEKERHEWASMTIYVFNFDFLSQSLELVKPLLLQQETVEFGRDLITYLANETNNKYRLYGYKYHGYWGYTRTLSEYWQANMNLLSSNIDIDLEQWKVRTNLDHRGIRDRMPAIVKSGAHINNSLISNGCVIDGEVVNSILSPGVLVKSGAKVYNSIMMFDTNIGENAFINNVILDMDVNIAPGASLGDEGLSANSSDLKIFGQGENIR